MTAAEQQRTMRKATGSGLPWTLLVKGYTDRPPVLRPMRSVSSMKLSFSVPICVSALHQQHDAAHMMSNEPAGAAMVSRADGPAERQQH